MSNKHRFIELGTLLNFAKGPCSHLSSFYKWMHMGSSESYTTYGRGLAAVEPAQYSHPGGSRLSNMMRSS